MLELVDMNQYDESQCITEQYLKKHFKVGEFGVKYLDDKIGGILNDDFILIGARSGAGKTTLSNIIAHHNSEKGIKTALYSLENYAKDGFVTQVFNEYKKRTNQPYWRFRLFKCHAYDELIDFKLLREIDSEIKEKNKNLFEVNRQTNFGREELIDDMNKKALNGIKLFIIDHLDYIENADETSENIFMSQLMKDIRQLQEAYGVAVVAFSHLRKNGSIKFIPKIPSMDEFMGSSNKVKISTTVILFAPNEELNKNHFDDNSYPYRHTYCCIRKLRDEGINGEAADLRYNIQTGLYEQERSSIVGISYDGLTVYGGVND